MGIVWRYRDAPVGWHGHAPDGTLWAHVWRFTDSDTTGAVIRQWWSVSVDPDRNEFADAETAMRYADSLWDAVAARRRL